MIDTEVGASKLRISCDPDTLGFRTTDELTALNGTIGQARAVEAITLAAEMAHKRFNLVVHGAEGSGRHSTVMRLLTQVAKDRPAPCDWAYVENFAEPESPVAISLAAGEGPKLRAAMAALVEDLADRIPSVMISDDYQNRRMALEQEFSSLQEAAFESLAKRALKRRLAVLRTPTGFSIAATQEGEILKPEVIEALPKRSRARIERDMLLTQRELEDFLSSLPEIGRRQREAMAALNARMAEKAVQAAMVKLERDFAAVKGLPAYFTALRNDLIQNADLFLSLDQSRNDEAFPKGMTALQGDPRFHRYAVNVITTHDPGQGAPVVVESMPTLANLSGQIEYIQMQGALVTDFTQIRAGALHRANGGFMILDARRVLTEPFAWDALKRCLETDAIHVTTGADRLGLVATTTLSPEPIPLKLRVVLVGDQALFLDLAALDPQFGQFFGVEAEFAGDMPRDPAAIRHYAEMLATVVQAEGLRPVSVGGVAALIDESTRVAEDQTKLSLQTSPVLDLLREADHIAASGGSDVVSADHVAGAIAARLRRRSLTPDRLAEMMQRDRILISTHGAVVGQINGLVVAELGENRFGAPVRITARARMGQGRVVDIEREAKTGGPIHSKAVLILSGFLAGRYAPEVPLCLWASLVFEQNYGRVEGDSASLGELCALMSALAGVPVSQSYAVTGSVNQLGDVQPVGGVNEKIEGFFDLCLARGLTGRQGVLLPAANLGNLMLRPDLVKAVAAGKFYIHGVAHVDQAISLLTGLPAGTRSTSGEFESGSINANIEVRLAEFARAAAGAGQDE